MHRRIPALFAALASAAVLCSAGRIQLLARAPWCVLPGQTALVQ